MIQRRTKKKDVTFKPSPITIPQASRATSEELTKVYSQYAQDIVVETNDVGMSLLEQTKQQGFLDSLYVDNNKLKLKAIINGGVATAPEKDISGDKKLLRDVSALISVVNIKSGKAKIEKFRQHSQVYGYHLLIKNNTQVVLSKTNGEKKQEIVLLMYK